MYCSVQVLLDRCIAGQVLVYCPVSVGVLLVSIIAQEMYCSPGVLCTRCIAQLVIASINTWKNVMCMSSSDLWAFSLRFTRSAHQRAVAHCATIPLAHWATIPPTAQHPCTLCIAMAAQTRPGQLPTPRPMMIGTVSTATQNEELSQYQWPHNRSTTCDATSSHLRRVFGYTRND